MDNKSGSSLKQRRQGACLKLPPWHWGWGKKHGRYPMAPPAAKGRSASELLRCSRPLPFAATDREHCPPFGLERSRTYPLEFKFIFQPLGLWFVWPALRWEVPNTTSAFVVRSNARFSFFFIIKKDSGGGFCPQSPFLRFSWTMDCIIV